MSSHQKPHWTVRKMGKAWFAHDGDTIPTYYYGAPTWAEVIAWTMYVRRMPRAEGIERHIHVR